MADADDPLAITDADLVARIAAGDIDAPMAELCRRYETWLYRCGLQALGDTGLAQDMVQECFLRLWRNAGQFDPARGSVGTYLLVIGRSVAADILSGRRPGRLSNWKKADCRRSWTASTRSCPA